MSKNLFLCSHCRIRILHAGKALFVDQSTNRPFCSEKCILDFHAPFMESFERQEVERREQVGAPVSEGLEEYYQLHDLFQKALYAPEEVWFEKNAIGEEYHTHIASFNRDGNSFFYVVICSYFDNEPSFVFFKLLTKNRDLVQLYRGKTQVDPAAIGKPSSSQSEVESDKVESLESRDEQVKDEIAIPQEVLEDLELKKSEYLASLLQNRKDGDISFEEFTNYDKYLAPTLEDPDEIYFQEDATGDQTRTYIKSFQMGAVAFFYVVVCLKVDIKQLENEEALLPVIGFPSIDQDLYKDYAVGERVSEMIKN